MYDSDALSHNTVRAIVLVYQGNIGIGMLNTGLRDWYCDSHMARDVAKAKAK